MSDAYTSDFVFEIDEPFEIRKDPIGHHHHYLAMTGRLVQGVIAIGIRIRIPCSTPPDSAAVIIGFDKFNNRALQTARQLSAGEIDEPFALATWRVATIGTHIQRNAPATPCSEAEYETLIREMLVQAPEHLLHCHTYSFEDKAGQTHTHCRDCFDCWSVIRHREPAIEGLYPLMTALTRHDDSYIRERAQHWIKETGYEGLV